ncbi:MAG: outer membrane protein [Bosea sp. (in: a-proteobacteria)]
MKTISIGGVAVLAGLMAAGAANAADLPARKGFVPAPITMAPAFMWNGFYAGVNAGYSFNSNKASTVGTPGFVALGANVPGSLRTGKDGFIGGAQIGYNYQIGSIVLGVETDLQYVDGKRTSAFTGPALGGITTSASSELTYLGTLRARLGLVASERLMIYATGGLAYGNPKNSAAVATGTGALWGGGSDATRFGYAIGAGAEYALTNNWTAKLEYLYYDLGRRTVNAGPLNAAATATGVAYQARFENSGSIVRGGLNYKF